jgi:lipopolysaccharide transport system permease protein
MVSPTIAEETDLGSSSAAPVTQTSIIRPSRGWSSLGLGEIWERRELLYFLIVREVQGAHRQTALGLSWIFLRPVINMLLLSLVFGRVVRVPSDGVPYPLFALAGLVPWGFFSNAVTRASRSLVENLHVISKVYFPRMIIPVASAVSGLIDFAAALLVLFVVLLLYRSPLRWEMLWLPLFLLVTLAFALAVGLWLATLSVKYRDVSFAITFLLQALMYASPVIYPVSLVPNSVSFLYQLNPMSAVIQGFRWAFLGSGAPPGLRFLLSSLLVIIGTLGGAYMFRRTERTVVDMI